MQNKGSNCKILDFDLKMKTKSRIKKEESPHTPTGHEKSLNLDLNRARVLFILGRTQHLGRAVLMQQVVDFSPFPSPPELVLPSVESTPKRCHYFYFWPRHP